MGYKHWTPAEIRLMRQLAREGKTTDETAAIISQTHGNERTGTALRYKASELRVSFSGARGRHEVTSRVLGAPMLRDAVTGRILPARREAPSILPARREDVEEEWYVLTLTRSEYMKVHDFMLEHGMVIRARRGK